MPWPLIAVQETGAIRVASGPRGDLPELAPFAYNVIVAKPETCEKRPTVCQRLVAGLAQAFTFIHDRPKDSMAILAKHLPAMDPKIFAEGFEVQRQATPKSPRVQEQSLAKAQDFMLATGMLNAGEKVSSFKELYTNKYVGN
jgi:ABC-type nitrate/sulfonate/bicarbonate transport system substrate-binding protein